jgi:hypothetical protein
MIPPHYRLGSTVVVRPSRFGVVPGSIPGLAILFSSYRRTRQKALHEHETSSSSTSRPNSAELNGASSSLLGGPWKCFRSIVGGSEGRGSHCTPPSFGRPRTRLKWGWYRMYNLMYDKVVKMVISGTAPRSRSAVAPPCAYRQGYIGQ